MIKGKHLDVGEHLQTLLEQECRDVIQKYMHDDHVNLHIVVKKNHHIFHIEGHIDLSRRHVIHCSGHDANAYKAASQLVHQLDARLKRYKDRLRDKKRGHARSTKEVGCAIIDLNQVDEGHDVPVIVADTTKSIEMMTVSDAVMQVDLSNQHFLFFHNASHGQINVVYRRDDGHIGWIDPTRVSRS